MCLTISFFHGLFLSKLAVRLCFSINNYILCAYSIAPIVSHANDKFAIKPLNIRFKNPQNTFLTIKSLLSCSRIYCTRGRGFYCRTLRFSLKSLGLPVTSSFQLVPMAVILNIPDLNGAGISSFCDSRTIAYSIFQYQQHMLSGCRDCIGRALASLLCLYPSLHTRLW